MFLNDFGAVCTAVHKAIAQNDYKDQLILWKKHLNAPFWQNCLKFADECDYDALKEFITILFLVYEYINSKKI